MAWRVCVGACHAALDLREDWKQQLQQVHKECGFEYVRFHGLLDDDMEVYSEDAKGQAVYNWKKVDALYDSILKAGMRPFVELGFMPTALASGTQTIFFYKGNVTPPKSYEKWGALIEALVRHWEERYGRAEVKRWYFEVWNEPNLGGFWAGTEDEYFKLYQASSKAIKRVCVDYQVGGPGSAGGGLIKETIDYCQGVPRAMASPGTALSGMKGEYFKGIALEGKPLLSRGNETLNFTWNDGSSPDAAIPANGFSARWTGQLKPKHDGQYFLTLRSDDGVRVWVDGKLVVDEWSDHAPQTNTAPLALKAGLAVPLRIEYYQAGGGAMLQASWREASREEKAQGTKKYPPAAPIDFISTHSYGTNGHLDEFGQTQNWLLPNLDSVVDSFKDFRKRVSLSLRPELPIHITEWSTSYSPRDCAHDSYISAAYILNTVKKTEGLVSSLSYWTFTDIFEEPGLPDQELHGGFGLLTISGLKKPSYFAFNYLNRLGETELKSSDEASWVCRSEKGVQVLLWDAQMLVQDQKTEPNNVFFVKDLKAKDSGKARVELSHLPAGIYHLSVHKVGYATNDLFDVYRKAGSPKKPDAKQMAAFKKATQDKPVLAQDVKIGANGRFQTELAMRQNDVFFIELTR